MHHVAPPCTPARTAAFLSCDLVRAARCPVGGLWWHSQQGSVMPLLDTGLVFARSLYPCPDRFEDLPDTDRIGALWDSCRHARWLCCNRSGVGVCPRSPQVVGHLGAGASIERSSDPEEIRSFFRGEAAMVGAVLCVPRPPSVCPLPYGM